MQQHAVPQQISSYEFRLVGDMTLKQFGQVAGGVIIGLLFYASSLPTLIKWPLIILPIILGVAMAFFPIEERPIQTWIIAFFKAVYSPTQYFWQKKPYVPEILSEEKKLVSPAPSQKAKSTADQERLRSYLVSLPKVKSTVEVEEEKFLDKIQKLFLSLTPPSGFETGIPAKIEASPPEKEEPAGVRTRKLTGSLVMEVEGQKTIPEEAKEKMEQEAILSQLTPAYIPVPAREKPKTQALEAEFGQIPMPSAPTVPNVIVGMVIDKEGKIVEGAIIEIRDDQGNPVRAFKTNKLGQFQVVTPLGSGNYEIEIEKEGHQFEVYKFRLTGKIMEPIRIRAK